MIVTVNYHGNLVKKINKFQEKVEFNYASSTSVLYLLLHVLQKYDTNGDLLFGTKKIVLNKHVKIKVNDALVVTVGVEIRDGDIIDIYDGDQIVQ